MRAMMEAIVVGGAKMGGVGGWDESNDGVAD